MIVGLGNPGPEYAGTRHNVGFEVIDGLAGRLDIKVKKKKFGALFGEGFFGDSKVILLKPQKYMNRSGQVAAVARGFYKLSVENIIVITDDMALEAGRVRIRLKGSSGGHNGLEDIIAKLGTNEFGHLRIGIGGSGEQIARDYVLSRPAEEDRKLIEEAIDRAQQAICCWIEQGVDTAMNKFNVPGST